MMTYRQKFEALGEGRHQRRRRRGKRSREAGRRREEERV
jgi:hypothetical protein